MDDISQPQFTAMDQAANVASYARDLVSCDDRTCGNLGCSPSRCLCVHILCSSSKFPAIIAFVRTRKKHDYRVRLNPIDRAGDLTPLLPIQ
jgi:hypothetical protein